MSQTATAAIVDQRMEPIAKQETIRPIVITGQALYDQFMVSNDGDKTRMGLIRQLADTADALQIKGACDKMVELAVLVDYPEGKPKKGERKSKEQQAMNVRTIIQSGWGALHYARSQAESLGYDDTTGYLAMRVIAQKALANAGINWKGEGLKTDADKERARLLKSQREEQTALVDVQKANPRLINESLQSWNDRVFALAQNSMEEAKETAESKLIEDLFVKLLEKHGEERMIALASHICQKFEVDIIVTESEETTEPSEQETLDAMAQVSEELANA